MKASNDLIKKFGVDKIIHGLIGMLILAVCVIASVFLFGVNFFSVLGGMILGTVSAWLAGKWKESKDDVPDAADIRATVRGALLADVVILLVCIMKRLHVQLWIAVFLSVSGMILLFCGFWVVPTGQIDNSVLVAYGEVSTFAGALFGVDYRYKCKYKKYIEREDETENKEENKDE